VLTCQECSATGTDEAGGWQGHLAYDAREDEASYVVFFCPSCAAREFGDDPNSQDEAGRETRS
jgi:hypothetical protein